MSIEQFNNKTFDIIRVGELSELGDEVYFKVATLQGFFQETTGQEAFLRSQQYNNVAYVGYISINADIKVGDRFQDNNTQDAYRVIKVMDAAGRKHHKEVYIESMPDFINVPTIIPLKEL